MALLWFRYIGGDDFMDITIDGVHPVIVHAGQAAMVHKSCVVVRGALVVDSEITVYMFKPIKVASVAWHQVTVYGNFDLAQKSKVTNSYFEIKILLLKVITFDHRNESKI